MTRTPAYIVLVSNSQPACLFSVSACNYVTFRFIYELLDHFSWEISIPDMQWYFLVECSIRKFCYELNLLHRTVIVYMWTLSGVERIHAKYSRTSPTLLGGRLSVLSSYVLIYPDILVY